MGLHNVDQLFIQNMMASRYLSVPKAIQLYNHCLEIAKRSESNKVRDDQDLESRMSKINRHLESIELQLKAMHCPRERVTYWGLCNTVGDEAACMATHFSVSELELFFNIIDELREYNGELELKIAQNLIKGRLKSVKEVSRAIAKFSEAGWLKIMRASGAETMLIFGPRALLELPVVRNWALRKMENVVVEHEDERARDGAEKGSEQEVQRSRRRARRTIEEPEDEEDEIQPLPSQRRRTASRGGRGSQSNER